MKYLLHLLLISSYILHAHIVTHHEFSDVLLYVSPDDYHPHTLVALDIDNTIGHHKCLIGSDQWVTACINKKVAQGMPYAQALSEVLVIYYAVQHVIDLIPVQEITPLIIKQLQDSGVTVVAITYRSLDISDRTIAQLEALGIDFSRSPIAIDITKNGEVTYLYKKGIIFCHGNNKGQILKKIFDLCNYKPSKVIAVDDKEHHLQSISQALDSDTHFVGIRYAYLDEYVAQFDEMLAQKELDHFLIHGSLHSF